MEKSKSVENLNKCDTRRRKKRPAPRPPSALRSPSVTEKQIVEDPDNEKVQFIVQVLNITFSNAFSR